MAIEILSMIDLGNDVLKIIATDGATETVVIGRDANGKSVTADVVKTYEAVGWVSAMKNHYVAADYEANGHRKPGATAKVMTNDQKLAYARSLVSAQADDVKPSTESPVLYTLTPEAVAMKKEIADTEDEIEAIQRDLAALAEAADA